MNKLGPDDSDRRVRNDFEKLRADFKYMQSQNIDLRRQINEIQNILKDKIKQSEIWKTMYDRAVMYFPTNEINALKHSFEIEKLNLIQGDQENETNNNKSKINTLISKLNEENFGLKMQLERVKSSVKQEMEHLSKFQSENKKIKNEFHSMKEFVWRTLCTQVPMVVTVTKSCFLSTNQPFVQCEFIFLYGKAQILKLFIFKILSYL